MPDILDNLSFELKTRIDKNQPLWNLDNFSREEEDSNTCMYVSVLS